jgi:hypothetical protein
VIRKIVAKGAKRMYTNIKINQNIVTTQVATNDSNKASIWQRIGKAMLNAFSAFGLASMYCYPLEASEYFHYSYHH